MTERRLPRYPIYIPTKGRSDKCLTARFLVKDGVPFRLVVEEQEHDAYAAEFGEKRLLVLPFSDRGSVIPARNWIKEHATSEGHLRHWQLDDNIRLIRRWWRGRRLPCRGGIALAITEDFTERYENVAISGLNYTMFAISSDQPPYQLNCRVYSCTLVLNSLPNKWRGRYNEDTDLCLQVLADGWCTILMNAFLIEKKPSMSMPGGNTDALDYLGDGRAKMARSLERVWPGVVETKRRFRRPQHVVANQWRRFDTPLIRKADVVVDESVPDEGGMALRQAGETIRSAELKRMVKRHEKLGDEIETGKYEQKHWKETRD